MTQEAWLEIGFNTDIKNGIKFNVMEKGDKILKGVVFLKYLFGVTCPYWLSLLFLFFCHQVVLIHRDYLGEHKD